MANVRWQISGEYFEACSCDSVCPCPTSGLAARPSKGYCAAGLVFRVGQGQHGSTRLDGLSFAVLLRTPGPMVQGDWTVGLIVDERASAEQRDALTGIASGQDGGPMAALAPLISHSGAPRRSRSGSKGAACAARCPSRVCSTSPSRVLRGPRATSRSISTMSGIRPPVALALAKASRSHMHAFGIDWDDTSGRNNGHFAPFAWSSS